MNPIPSPSTSSILQCAARTAVSLLLASWVAGCVSVKQMAINKLGDALAGGGTVFSADDDPELIRAAVPFSLKLMESLLAGSPRHEGLLLAACSGFTQYGYAFVQDGAETAGNLATSREIEARARRLYLRARDYGLRALDVAHPGFAAQLGRDPRSAAATTKASDVPALYWTAVSWAAAISLSKDDARLIADLPKVEAMIDRALALEESWDGGAIHGFLITFEMGRATGEGDPAERARRHFDRAVDLSGGRSAGPFLSYAESVCIEREDRAQFEQLVRRALAINPDDDPPTRLANLVAQRHARRLLGRIDKLFLPPLPTET
jgi:predicted anti-sigma-YlaC factor YlaD